MECYDAHHIMRKAKYVDMKTQCGWSLFLLREHITSTIFLCSHKLIIINVKSADISCIQYPAHDNVMYLLLYLVCVCVVLGEVVGREKCSKITRYCGP